VSDTPKLREGTPEVIYLQTGDIGDWDVPFEGLDQVTWSEDAIDDDDPKYIRADVAERENADLRHDIERHVKIAADQATEMEDLRAKLADQRAAMMDLSTVKVAPDAEWLRGFAAQCIAAIDAAIAQKEGK
jgi:hypothetical protein